MTYRHRIGHRAALRTLLALVSLGASAGAQSPHLEWSGGVLGGRLAMQLEGPPLQPWSLMITLSDPGPQAPIFFTVTGAFDAAGAASLDAALPADPSLGGQWLSARFATAAPGPRPGFGAGPSPLAGFLHQGLSFPLLPSTDLSNEIRFVLGFPKESRIAPGKSAVPRQGPSATPLVDGHVLVTGGLDASGSASAYWELFDPQVQGFVASGSMPSPRALHSGTRLADGRVLLLGGVGPGGAALRSGLLFDPATSSFAPIPDMAVPRVDHTATLLGDGRVLVVGGTATYETSKPLGGIGAWYDSTSSVELFDPATGAWSDAPPQPAPLVGHRATRLADGRVLVTGGVRAPAGPGSFPRTTFDCLAFDPAVGLWQVAPPLVHYPMGIAYHAQAPTAGGGAVVVGGISISPSTGAATGGCSVLHLEPAAGGGWLLGPDLPTICIDGCCRCLDTPKGPVYNVAGGYRSIDVATETGVAAASSTFFELSPSSVPAPLRLLEPRPFPRCPQIDLHRFALLGAGGPIGSIEGKVEIVTFP